MGGNRIKDKLAHIPLYPTPTPAVFAGSQAKIFAACPCAYLTLLNPPFAATAAHALAAGQVTQPRLLTTAPTMGTFLLINPTDTDRRFDPIIFPHLV